VANVTARPVHSPDDIRRLAPMTDFFGIGAEIWEADDPAAALKTLLSAMG